MTNEESEVCKYGTPLEPLDEEELPRNKPPTIEEQYAVDDHGRRRFHGAFTGGFSAGFYNTVGSLEGWTPSTFKSSRKSKAESKLQKPEDFMDTEDREEWGIAPKRLQTTSDYTETVNKKKRYIGPTGAIPGDPILHCILKPPADNIGKRLLKLMGWREGQGTGPRKNKPKNLSEEQEDCSLLTGLTFGPSDCENYEYTPKLDSFGMGYTGLDRDTFSKPFSLFEPSTLNIIDKNKKFSVQGQAFGVGTFEDEDEDIYHREDMTQYDFMLENDTVKKPTKKQPEQNVLKLKCISGFVLSNAHTSKIKTYQLPNVPKNYVPTCGRKTRFSPAVHKPELKIKDSQENYLRRGLGRHDLDPEKRRQILDSNSVIFGTESKDNEEENKKLLNQANSLTSKLGSVTTFKPFAADPEKEKRYNLFISFKKEERAEKLRYMQPFGMTEWERDRECREFEQALRLYKPLQGSMSDRFVSGGASESKDVGNTKLKTEEEAAQKKMFGKLTRKVELWQPVNLLCKRFNVPEPLGGWVALDDANKKSSNYSVFEYTEASVNRKRDYVQGDKNETDNTILIENQETKIETVVRNESEIFESSKKEIAVTSVTEVPANKKTSFEKEIEQKLSNNLPENKNLFKLIFADSSDSESEDVKDKEKENVDEMKSYLLSDDPISKNNESETKNKAEQNDKNKNSGFGIFANVDLDALKAGTKTNFAQTTAKIREEIKSNTSITEESKTHEKKILFQAPSKNKREATNTFSTISCSLNKNTKDVEENELDSKILEYLAKSKKKIDKDASSSKVKKSKKKHKLKEKKKNKKKEKKSKKDKADKKRS